MSFWKGDMYSYALGKMMPFSIYLPHDDKRRFSVNKPMKTLVLLHGICGNNSYWSRYTCIERLAQNYNLALIMPDGDISQYCDMKYGLPYDEFIGRELKESIGNMFNIPVDYNNYYIAGLSMGGYGALRIGLKYSGTFSKIGSFSGATMFGTKEYLEELSLWKDPGEPLEYEEDYSVQKIIYQSSKAAFGNELAYKTENDIFYWANQLSGCGLQKPRILMTCGTEDFLYKQNLQCKGKLQKSGFEVLYHEWKGQHEWKFWDESIEKHIGFFGE